MGKALLLSFCILSFLLAIAHSQSQQLSPQEILNNHSRKPANVKNFNGETLAYVTPWNGRGYDVAKWFPSKFTYVSPVWFSIKSAQSKFEITGGHDVDLDWLNEVRGSGPNRPKIVPRFSASGWGQLDFVNVIGVESIRKSLIDTIMEEVKKYPFDGIVLEIQGPEKHLFDLVSGLSESLRSNGLILIMVIPPQRDNSPSPFSKADFVKFSPVVDRFSLMTYDYSNPQKPGANAPLNWVKKSIEHISHELGPEEKKKILVGLNFYGNDYYGAGGGAIVASDYLNLVRHHRPKIQWNSAISEHVFSYNANTQKHTVYYPSKDSIQFRVDLAKSLGVGISIWEIGQGLDYWYELF